MDPNCTHRTDRRVEITRTERPGARYRVSVSGGPTFEAGLLNIGSRTAAFPAGNTLEFGGGDGTIIIKSYDDSRSNDGELLAVGFETAAVL